MVTGFSYQPPSVISSTYNPQWFAVNSQSITLTQAKSLFYSIYGGTLFGSITLQGNIIGSGSSTISSFASISSASASIASGVAQLTINSSSNSAGRSTIAFQNDVSTFELGLRGSTNGTYSNELYIYNGSSYLMHLNSAGWMSLLSTTPSSSSTTGSLLLSGGIGINNSTDASSSSNGGSITTAGGVAIAKKLYVGSSASISGAILQGDSTDTARAVSCLNNSLGIGSVNYICLGRSTTLYNQMEMSFQYAGNGSTSNQIQFGFFGSARLLTIDASGSTNITSTTDASSSSSGGALTISGGVGIAKKLYVGSSINSNTATIGSNSNTGGTLSITSVGYHLGMYYASNIFGTLSTGSSGDLVLASTNGGTSTYYTFSNSGQVQLSGIAPRNGNKFDLGTNTSKDNILILGQANNASPSYMFGINNSTLEYVSGSAHAWYANTSTTPAVLGNLNMSLTQQGSLILQNSGFHAYGSDTTGLSSINQMGAHLQVVSGTTQLLGFNYSTSSFGDMNIQSSLFYKASNGYWGIGTSSPTSILHVSGTAPQSTASGFGFLASGGAGSASGFTNRQFSIYCSGGIMCGSGEIDVLSDIRQKQKIKAIDSELAERFITEIEPIEYCYIHNPAEMHYGYSAQSLVAHGYDRIVGYTGVDDEPLEEMTIECANGDVLHLPSDTRLIVNMLNTIPLLHTALKRALERIDALENKSKRTRAKK